MGALTTLNGFDDWNNLTYDFRSAPDFADGIHTSPHDIPSLTADQVLATGGWRDPDGDGITSADDNCPLVSNPSQQDFDRDGDGDPCDPDDDGDGLDDDREAELGSDPLDRDTDGDLYADGTEVAEGSDPANPFSFPTPAGPVTLVENPPVRELPVLDGLEPVR